MKYIEILNKGIDCDECFVQGEFTTLSSLPKDKEQTYFTHRWHPKLSEVACKEILVLEAYQKPINFDVPEFKKSEEEMRSHLKAISCAKVPQSICLLKLVPDFIYKRFCESKSKILESFLWDNEKPKNYEHFLNIKKMVDSISRREVVLDPSRVKSTKQLKLVRSDLRKVAYDPCGTATGRLTTKKGSFPIMTLSSKDRSFIVPTNDLFVEFDFNAAEIRTLLSLSGSEQPSCDIHEWNRALLGDTCTDRKSAKEQFFAWLYNPSRVDQSLEKSYNKSIYKHFYDPIDSIVSTPFGRQLHVDESKALNYLIQSTSSDMMLEQAHKVGIGLQNAAHGSFIKFLMHDSILLDIKKQDLPLMSNMLEVFSKTRFGKYLINVRYGKDFSNLKELKWKI